jgi:hypothetical protein
LKVVKFLKERGREPASRLLVCRRGMCRIFIHKSGQPGPDLEQSRTQRQGQRSLTEIGIRDHAKSIPTKSVKVRIGCRSPLD